MGPADTVVQEEIFGPVLTMMSFRTPAEAVALANNTRYGLSASVWSENINLALGVAPQIRAGVVWVNGANMLDAAAGFGGVRESGYGREGGREGMMAYLRPVRAAAGKEKPARRRVVAAAEAGLDRTAKLYIGGKQARPDSGYSLPVHDAAGGLAGHVGLGNRKDVRNAVEAAQAAGGWAGASAYARSQVLYYLAENLEARRAEFAGRIAALGGISAEAATAEVRRGGRAGYRLRRLGRQVRRRGAFGADPRRGAGDARADRRDGHRLPGRADARSGCSGWWRRRSRSATGWWWCPSETQPLVATDLYQVLETSDLPGGVVNIVTGRRADLVPTLADHLDVAAVWYYRAGRRDRRGGAALGGQPQAHACRRRAGPDRVPQGPARARGAGEEHLDPLRRVRLLRGN